MHIGEECTWSFLFSFPLGFLISCYCSYVVGYFYLPRSHVSTFWTPLLWLFSSQLSLPECDFTLCFFVVHTCKHNHSSFFDPLWSGNRSSSWPFFFFQSTSFLRKEWKKQFFNACEKSNGYCSHMLQSDERFTIHDQVFYWLYICLLFHFSICIKWMRITRERSLSFDGVNKKD